MFDQQRLRQACAYKQAGQSLCLSIQYSMVIKLLTKHHLEFLKGGCIGSSGIYTCQSVTLLEITCLSSFTETCVGEPMISGNYSLIDNQAFSASSSRDASHLPANSRWYSGSMGKYMRGIWKVVNMASYVDKMLPNNTFLETTIQWLLDGLIFVEKGLRVHVQLMLKTSRFYTLAEF